MFYENQPKKQQIEYKEMLCVMGNLTRLFSESDCPYLPYRTHENVFCKCFNAKNLGRKDCSADAVKNHIGIGLKTWTGQDDQKIAEFGKLKKSYEKLTGIELVTKIAEYRNDRIRVTQNMYNIEKMIYHIVKRVPGSMQVLEAAFDYIDIDNIELIDAKGNDNNTYFTDEKHTYHFSTAKNTLYMIFSDMDCLDSFNVEIMDDPYDYLMHKAIREFAAEKVAESKVSLQYEKKNRLCLRLYSTKKNGYKFVPLKSGLNQWNASGRKRNPDEIYISYPVEDRITSIGFFPGKDTVFELELPDGTVIPAKICQADGKAIMSNPNKVLGKWLLRKVFELPERTIMTYQMLETYGIDSVIFTKQSEKKYSIDFTEIGTYEALKNNIDN